MKHIKEKQFWSLVRLHLTMEGWWQTTALICGGTSIVFEQTFLFAANDDHLVYFYNPCSLMMLIVAFYGLFGDSLFQFPLEPSQSNWKGFVFSRAIDRRMLFWSRNALLWAVLALSLGSSLLAIALNGGPQLGIRLLPSDGNWSANAQGVYWSAFPGAYTKMEGRDLWMILPTGKFSVWLNSLMGEVSFILILQLICLGALPRGMSALGLVLLIVAAGLLVFFSPILLTSPHFFYERQLGLVNHYGVIILVLLGLAVYWVQGFCGRKYIVQDV